jgi:hypothetical protein
MKQALKMAILSAFVFTALTNLSYAATLWYNGDYDGSGMWSASYYSSNTNYQYIYEDFNVPTGGWTVNSVWANDIMYMGDNPAGTPYTSVQAKWEIRSGVSSGNLGTLEASGTSSISPAFVQQNNFGGYYEDLYKIQVDNLNIVLPEGTYWLTVAPIVTLPAGSYEGPSVGNTSKTNAVGDPSAINGNNYYYKYDYDFNTGWGNYLRAISEIYTFGPVDFSMGVGNTPTTNNTVVPEPATLSLLGLGLAGLLFKKKIRIA